MVHGAGHGKPQSLPRRGARYRGPRPPGTRRSGPASSGASRPREPRAARRRGGTPLPTPWPPPMAPHVHSTATTVTTRAVPTSSLLVCVSAPPAAPLTLRTLPPTRLRHEAAHARRRRAPACEHGAQLAAHCAAQLVQPALGERRRGAAFRAAFRVLRVAEGRCFLQQPLLQRVARLARRRRRKGRRGSKIDDQKRRGSKSRDLVGQGLLRNGSFLVQFVVLLAQLLNQQLRLVRQRRHGVGHLRSARGGARALLNIKHTHILLIVDI